MGRIRKSQKIAMVEIKITINRRQNPTTIIAINPEDRTAWQRLNKQNKIETRIQHIIVQEACELVILKISKKLQTTASSPVIVIKK